ncbi:C40 family peptidase [Nocardia xishanensis]|uniref:C40 family peptidase n=1 Tax=Nocardia xishanensis TaxID=238964 RepID=UPI000A819631|nr:NlpC/P60 family protein [Nocardia xishanensis]
MDTSSRAVIATALGLPAALLLLMLIVGAEPTLTCTTPLASGGAAGVSGPTGQTVAGLSEGQLQLARNGVAIGKQRGMPESVIVSELAAQATESSFRNLANPTVPESLNYANDGLGYDHDSVGPHQMRASIWGSVGIAKLMDPVYQINWFYDQAERLGNTAGPMSPAELAQEIERSAPNAYAGQLELARRLYALFADIDPASMPRTPAGAPAAGCGPNGSGTPLPAQASEFGRAVIEHAARWIGTPYVWGGGDTTGPTGGGFDCSGLTLYAVYHASGGRIRLPHYTQAQQDHPTAQIIPFAERAPGDLIFFTAQGDTDSHHVGIYYGRDEQGRDLLLHAPQSGQTVTLTPLSAWDGEHIDVRRYSVPATSSPDTSLPGGRT